MQRVENLEYNTEREQMVMKEYGRIIHKMVQNLTEIDDDSERQKRTEELVEIMATLFPPPKNVEVDEKLFWDSIFIMSDFQLEVDSPYPLPTPEEVYAKPESLPYPQSKVRYKHFGKNFETLLDDAMQEEDEDERNSYIQRLAQYMKLAYLNWHNDSVDDPFIAEELAQMSQGKLQYSPDLYVKLTDNNKQPNIKNNITYKRKSKSSYKKKRK